MQEGKDDASPEIDLIKDRLDKHEGSKTFPYRDNKGVITIGTGFNVNNKSAFLALPLIYEDEEAGIAARYATREEKAAAYKTLKAINPGNKTADDYMGKTKVMLSQAYIDQRYKDEIVNNRIIAKNAIGDEAWGKLTVAQRAAAVNIVFNVGSLAGYPKFVQAAKDGDALEMARQSLASIDPDDNKTSDLKHHWARSRDKFCDITGYGPNKCNAAFDAFLNSQTKFQHTTEQDRERAGPYVPPAGAMIDDGPITEAENTHLTAPLSDEDTTAQNPQQPVPPAEPARPGAAAQPQPQPQPPEDERVRPGRNQPPNPGQAPQAGPAPRPGQTPPGQTPPGQPRPGQPGQGPGQAPGQRPAQGPVPPPARGPGRGDERGSLSPEDGFGKLADIPANDVASKDDRDGRQGTPMRMEDYERILGHDVFRDEVAAHMAEPNPEDDGPADKRMQFGINMSLIAHGRMPKYVNGEPAVMAPLRHDIEGKPIKDTLAKTSQNFAAMADQIGVIPAVKVTQGALNDLRGPAEPIKEDGEFGPISKETMRDRLFRYGYDKVRLQMQQRYQAMRRQGEERR